MNRFLLLVIALVLFASVAPAQIVCIYCFDTNDSISSNVTNLIQNGSFENHNCTPNTNGSSYCPNSAAYQCNLTNWTCTGGGSGTYCQIFTAFILPFQTVWVPPTLATASAIPVRKRSTTPVALSVQVVKFRAFLQVFRKTSPIMEVL